MNTRYQNNAESEHEPWQQQKVVLYLEKPGESVGIFDVLNVNRMRRQLKISYGRNECHNRSMKSNLFDNVPEELPVELCETLVESSSVRIERIISKGHSSPEQGWYDQTENEWVMVVKGQASLLFEGDENPVPMQQGDYINIPAGRKHKVLWTHPDMETFWIAVFYS